MRWHCLEQQDREKYEGTQVSNQAEQHIERFSNKPTFDSLALCYIL
jgi:hypothetical protein